MEQFKEILKKVGNALWWLIQKLFLVIGTILQIIGNAIADNNKHK